MQKVRSSAATLSNLKENSSKYFQAINSQLLRNILYTHTLTCEIDLWYWCPGDPLDPLLFIELIEHTELFLEPNEFEQACEPPGDSGYKLIDVFDSNINSSDDCGNTVGSLVTIAIESIASCK